MTQLSDNSRGAKKGCKPNSGFPAPHINKISFAAVLGRVDIPSDRCPAGARQRPVVLSREVVERRLPTLLGMGVNFGVTAHDPTCMIGVITRAQLNDDEITVSGHLWPLSRPVIVREICASAERYGVSYEISDALIPVPAAKVWTPLDFCFSGICILPREKAAINGSRLIVATPTGEKS